MRPISVKFKCFGPYMAEQFVDFTLLEQDGIFLISGETGAGKTTILDAMCCALYGEASNKKRGDLEAMRCKLASNEDTAVEFIFENNGKRYKFVREIKMARKNLNESHNCMQLVGDVYVPLMENPTKKAVTKKAEEIIGLTAEQFCQIIILPQGQFETFLTSSSEEKEKILTQIFKADKWDKIAQWLHEKTKTAADALENERNRMALWLERYGCDTTEALELLCAEKAEELKGKKAAWEVQQKEYTEKKLAYEALVAEDVDFAALDKREAEYKQLYAESEGFAKEKEVLAAASEAEKLREDYEALQATRAAQAEAKTAALAALQEAASAEAKWQQAEAKKQAQAAQKAQNEEKRGRIAVYETKREVYTSLQARRQALEAEKKKYAAAEAAVAAAEKEAEQQKQALALKLQARDAAKAAYDDADVRYYYGIGGLLAQKLVEGRACLVCGSTSHPAPAQPALDAVSEIEYKRFKEAYTQAQTALEKATELCTAAELALADKRGVCEKLAQSVQSLEKEYNAALEARIEGVDTLEQLAAVIEQLQRAVRDYDAQTEKLQANLNAALAQKSAKAELCAAAEVKVKQAEESYGACLQNWQTKLAASVFETEAAYAAAVMAREEREARSAALFQKEELLKHAKQELDKQREKTSGKQRPALAAAKAVLAEAEVTVQNLHSAYALAEDAYNKLAADAEKLMLDNAAYMEKRKAVDENCAFSRFISGSNGIGLKRYVLGVMMTQITLQANALLRNVYGGRYRLYRRDEKAGNERKVGLALEVWDANNNERRSVATLSGGEKFLVALSLAIGLSSVVQAQGKGVHLEAMFVDEGFGSLSRNACADAIEILYGVQQSNGIVGVISHVEQLKDSITNCIEITKTDRGSVLKQRGI